MDLDPGRPLSKDEIVALLAEARGRTLLLVRGLGHEDMTRQHSPLMSPIVWDLGHIAHFEDVWLVRNVHDGGDGSEGLSGVYDPFVHPRATRSELSLPEPAEVERFMSEVRRTVMASVDRLDLSGDRELLRDGFVFRMVLQHEYQHNETILQTLQLKKGAPYRPPRAVVFPTWRGDDGVDPGCMVRFGGGDVTIGTDDRSEAYDNERPAHVVALDPFRIDVTPVTNGQYIDFMDDGGYGRRELWSEAGWSWVEEEGVRSPLYWTKEGSEWVRRTMDDVGPVDRHRPVCHVCYHEAEAFARWAGKRLPTEYEWEAAASWDPGGGRKLRFPWGDEPATIGRANVDALGFGVAPVHSFSGNVSPTGCYGMIGDVWEWTSSDFDGYPGYRTFPYREYSEVFFGDEYKVLRGGSWATRPGACRTTFRNWDYPIRRQIFSGFRCAADV